jgi:hypothetical protein
MTSPPSIPDTLRAPTHSLDTAAALAEDLGDALQAGALDARHVPLCGATGHAPSCPACVTALMRRGEWP